MFVLCRIFVIFTVDSNNEIVGYREGVRVLRRKREREGFVYKIC